MTKKHKRILGLYLLIIAVGFAMPFLLCWEEQLKWSLDIARTISILSASVLALFYFDPFGIRKNNLAKQHDNVIQILEVIFAQRILAETESSEPNKPSKMFSQHFMTTKHLDFILSDEFASSHYLTYPILLNLENFTEETKELVELKNSLFTPKVISEKMAFLEFWSASRTEGEYDSFSIVSWGVRQNQDRDKLYDEVNNEKITLKELFSHYQSVTKECVSWLESNSFSVKHLNIK